MNKSEENKKKIIEINEEVVKNHLGDFVKSTVEETLNGLLDEEANALCKAQRYERAPERANTWAGYYNRKLETAAGKVDIKIPKLRTLPF